MAYLHDVRDDHLVIAAMPYIKAAISYGYKAPDIMKLRDAMPTFAHLRICTVERLYDIAGCVYSMYCCAMYPDTLFPSPPAFETIRNALAWSLSHAWMIFPSDWDHMPFLNSSDPYQLMCDEHAYERYAADFYPFNPYISSLSKCDMLVASKKTFLAMIGDAYLSARYTFYVPHHMLPYSHTWQMQQRVQQVQGRHLKSMVARKAMMIAGHRKQRDDEAMAAGASGSAAPPSSPAKVPRVSDDLPKMSDQARVTADVEAALLDVDVMNRPEVKVAVTAFVDAIMEVVKELKAN